MYLQRLATASKHSKQLFICPYHGFPSCFVNAIIPVTRNKYNSIFRRSSHIPVSYGKQELPL